MTILARTRVVCLVAGFASSVVILGLSANLLHLATHARFSFTFIVFALAVSVITIAVLLLDFIVDRITPNTFMSWTAVDLCRLCVLWMLWIAVGSYTASMVPHVQCATNTPLVEDLSLLTRISLSKALSICQQVQSILALSFVNGIIFFALFIWILSVGMAKSSARHHPVWRSTLANLDILARDPALQANTSPTYGMANGGLSHNISASFGSAGNESGRSPYMSGTILRAGASASFSSTGATVHHTPISSAHHGHSEV